ncbi:MAG: prepilin-type N-terminal cleavage/methylation domain-containing protein [Bacilli bacterium]|nr:prepilin-type N-terminal cleavage/methylation domain-containing protein [Bacilli bacterium]
MKKKGFTLIELLAVIVILAAIALIIIPVVSNIITSSRNSANARSVEGHIDNVEFGIMGGSDSSSIGNQVVRTDGTIDDRNEKFGFAFPKSDTVVCKGYEIKKGLVTFATGCKADDWKTVYSYTSENGTVVGELAMPEVIYDAYEIGDIVKFDVTKGKKCRNSTSKTGTKEGCMQFYVIKESGTTSDRVTMILDHNTTPTVYWNSSGSNASGPNEVLASLKEDTKTWKNTIQPSNYTFIGGGISYTVNYTGYKARLIEANEVARIIGENSWYSTASTTILRINSEYNWLYSVLSNNGVDGDYDCPEDHPNCVIYGYWTVDAGISANNIAYVVNVSSAPPIIGFLSSSNIYVDLNYLRGVRPVITVLKSDLE